MRRRPGAITCVAASLAAIAAGCSTTNPSEPSFHFDGSRYAEVFQATKDALREHEFELERVDARNGVITTRPRPWAGLATPWIPHATGLNDSIVGLIQPEQRACRVTFARADSGADAAPSEEDLRLVEGPVLATVHVSILRLQRPGWRIGAPSVQLRSQAVDPALLEAGLQPGFVVDVGADRQFADELARKIHNREPAQAAATSHSP